MLAHGPISDGMFVCHRCDNPPCVNPSHLFLGTPADNVHDRDLKGRQARQRGQANGRARLTDDDVREIRRLAGSMLQREIGARFGVSQSYVSDVLHGNNRTCIS
jgi:hypothetical protein